MKFVTRILFSLVLFVSIVFNAQAGAYSPVLQVVPASTSTINVYSSGSAPTLTYTVTNKSTNTADDFVVKPDNGLDTSIVTASVTTNNCTSSLTTNNSCTFTVSLQGTGKVDTTTLSPKFCMSSGTVCSQPIASNRVTVQGNSGNPVPTISSLSVTTGPATGGQSVTITGTNLSNTTAVTFGGNTATITEKTSTTVKVTTPSSSTTGSVDVVVTNAAGSATDTNGFTYYTKKAYIANNTGNNLSVCTVNASTGALSSCSTTTGGGSFSSPWGLIENTASTYLYFVGFAGTAIFRCDLTQGAVSNCASAKSLSGGYNTIGVTQNPAGTYLYVSGSGGGVSVCSVSSSDGSIGTCTSTGSGFSFPYAIVINPANTFAYIANGGGGAGSTDIITKCTVSSVDGTLSSCAQTGSSLALTRAIYVSRSGSYAYIGRNLNGDAVTPALFKCDVNSSTGELSSCARTGYSDAGSTAFNFNKPLAITTNASSSYAYVSENGGNSVVKCDIASAGELHNCATTATGFSGPVGIAVAPVH